MDHGVQVSAMPSKLAENISTILNKLMKTQNKMVHIF